MTIEEIKKSDKDILVPKDIAEVLGCAPYSINCQAKADFLDGKNRLGFPVVIMGNRIKIPRQGFLNFWCGKLKDNFVKKMC